MELTTRMHIADHTRLVDHKGNGGPPAFFQIRPPAVERGPLRVECNRKREPKTLARKAHPLNTPIAGRFRMKDADHLESAIPIFSLQLAQRRRSRDAERTPVRPPAEQHDFASELRHLERR